MIWNLVFTSGKLICRSRGAFGPCGSVAWVIHYGVISIDKAWLLGQSTGRKCRTPGFRHFRRLIGVSRHSVGGSILSVFTSSSYTHLTITLGIMPIAQCIPMEEPALDTWDDFVFQQHRTSSVDGGLLLHLPLVVIYCMGLGTSEESIERTAVLRSREIRELLCQRHQNPSYAHGAL